MCKSLELRLGILHSYSPAGRREQPKIIKMITEYSDIACLNAHMPCPQFQPFTFVAHAMAEFKKVMILYVYVLHEMDLQLIPEPLLHRLADWLKLLKQTDIADNQCPEAVRTFQLVYFPEPLVPGPAVKELYLTASRQRFMQHPFTVSFIQ